MVVFGVMGSVGLFQWLQKIIQKNRSIFSRLVLPFSCPSKFVGIHKSKRAGAACEDQQKYLREDIFGGNNMTSKNVRLFVACLTF